MIQRASILYFTFVCLVSHSLVGQSLLKDINSSNGDGFDLFRGVRPFGNNVLFASESNGSSSIDFFISNLNDNSVIPFKSKTGHTFTNIYSVTKLNSFIIFNDTSGKDSLYISDGTITGTKVLRHDLQIRGATIQLGNILYFAGKSELENTGIELWRTDGTTVGTYMVKDIISGSYSSEPTNFITYNGKLFFSINITWNQRKLYKTDGTEANTVEIDDIHLAGISAVVDNKLLYPSTSSKLRLYDDTNQTITQTVHTASTTLGFQALGNKILYKRGSNLIAFDGVDEVNITNFISSPTEAPNVFLAHVIDGDILFLVQDSKRKTLSFYKSDGNMGDYQLIKELMNGVDRIFTYDNNGSTGGFYKKNGLTYFLLFNSFDGEELWATDLSDQGTTLISKTNDIIFKRGIKPPILNNIQESGNNLIFDGHDSSNRPQIYYYNTTTKNLGTLSTSNQGIFKRPKLHLVYQNVVFFSASDNQNGSELWRCSTALNDATIVADLKSDLPSSSNPNNFFNYQQKLYFTASDKLFGTELWETDGTTAGTKMTFDFSPKYSINQYGLTGGIDEEVLESTEFSALKVYNNLMYIITNGNDLWSYDGVNSPILIKRLDEEFNYQKSFRTYSIEFTEFNNALYFLGNNGLWKIDNNICTKIVSFGTYYPKMYRLTVLNDYMYFGLSKSNSPATLFRTDGTSAATVPIFSTNTDNEIIDIGSASNRLIFCTGLWGNVDYYSYSPSDTPAIYLLNSSNSRYDGVSETYNDYNLKFKNYFFPFKNSVLWFGDSPLGRGIHTSDGTPTSTTLAFSTGIWSSRSYTSKSIGNSFYYHTGANSIYKTGGTSNNSGFEFYGLDLFAVDSSNIFYTTDNGVLRLREITTNQDTVLSTIDKGNNYRRFTSVQVATFFKDWLFFTPYSAEEGRELWMLKIPCIRSNSFAKTPDNAIINQNIKLNYFDNIKTAVFVDSDSRLMINSTKSINLEPGFNTEFGSNFQAEVKGCEN